MAAAKRRKPKGVDLPRIEQAVREILLAVGEDPDREGLARTPQRVAKMYQEAFSGLRAKIDLMRDEVSYLDGKYGEGHEKWQEYKAGVGTLVDRAEATAIQAGQGQVDAAGKLVSLKEEAERLHREIPLTLPSDPSGPGRFGAYYTRLKYSLTWDRPWRVGPLADVVVRFDDRDQQLQLQQALASKNSVLQHVNQT